MGLPVDRLRYARNLNDFLNIAIETLFKRYIQKFSLGEGISFRTGDIYKELISLIQEIDKNLPSSNAYKGIGSPVIGNFLTPKENGERFINLVIKKVFNQNEKETRLQDIHLLKMTIKGGLGVLIDIAKTGNDKRLKNCVNEFRNTPGIKEYILRISEFDRVLDLVISLLKTLDKNELFSQIDTFFKENAGNLLKLANKKPGEKIEDKVKLEIINGAWKIVDYLITKDRVNLALDKIS